MLYFWNFSNVSQTTLQSFQSVNIHTKERDESALRFCEGKHTLKGKYATTGSRISDAGLSCFCPIFRKEISLFEITVFRQTNAWKIKLRSSQYFLCFVTAPGLIMDSHETSIFRSYIFTRREFVRRRKIVSDLFECIVRIASTVNESSLRIDNFHVTIINNHTNWVRFGRREVCGFCLKIAVIQMPSENDEKSYTLHGAHNTCAT